jgi:hypothetical protein
MRRSVALAFLLALVVASPAVAAHHLMQVTEVAPGGGQPDQFIELRDPVPEPFPNPAYSVAATDGSGTVIPGAVQELAPGPLRNTTAPFLIGGANVTPQDTPLQFAIPPQAARICFYDNGVGAGFPINCLGYGSVAVPPGQSAQRQSCGAVAAAPPTPDAANTETGACGGGGGGTGGGGGGGAGGGGGGGAGGGGGGGTGGDATDLTPPQQQLAARRRQDVDRVAVVVTLSEPGTVTVRGSVSVPDAARVVRFRPATRTVAANRAVRFQLRLARKARRAVKAAVRAGRRPRARITIAGRDESGNTSTAKRTIRLTD